jgi:high-affinity nickel-transport protein
VLAYTLGMRHAFDADHIAAIDNTTRKLVNDGKRPLSVGFFFSLGHSTIVFLLAVFLNFGIRALDSQVATIRRASTRPPTSSARRCSGGFLYLIAALNLIVMIGIVKVYREMKSGEYDNEELERQLNNRGFMNRFFGGYAKRIDTPWKMYPVGVLFGLGFDTATEGGAAGAGRDRRRRWPAVLRHPVAADPFRRRHEPVRHHRRLLHELRLRLGLLQAHPQGVLQPDHHRLSVFVAFFIGTIEILGLIGSGAN